MNFLDIRTVMFSQLVTDAACAAVLVSLWWQNRKRFAGTFHWVMDFIFQTTAVLLIILRGSIPDWMSIGVSNTLVIAGALMGFWGLERFVERKSPPIRNYLLLAAFIGIHLYFIYGHNNLDVRTLNISAALLIVCLQCAWLVLRRAGRSQAHAAQAVGWVFVLFCLVSIIRICIILFHPLPSNDFFQSGLYDALALIAYQILLILLAFSLTLMVNRRLIADVKIQEEKLAKAFHSSPYAILITRLSDGLILDVNRGFEAVTGYPASEAIGKTTLDLGLWVKPADRQAMADEISTKGEVRGREILFRAKSGREWTGEYYGEILSVNDEQFVLSSISDISERKRAEEKIRYQASLLENVNDAIVASDAEFRLTAWNAAAEKLYGWKAEDVLGKPGLDVMRTEWPAADAEEMRRTIAEQGNWRGEATQIRKDGTRIPVEVSSMVVRDSNGHITGYISINRDITDRRRAEEEIALLAKFPSENPNPVLRLAHDGTVLFANSSSQTLLTEWRCAVGEPAPKLWRDTAAESLKKTESLTVETESGGRQYSFVVNPVLQADYVNLYGRDETERKRAEEALQESEEKYRLIADSSNEWIYLNSPDSSLRYSSPSCERITGYTPKEFADDSNLLIRIVHPDDRIDVESHFKEIREDSVADSREFRIITKSGEIRWIQHSCALVHTPDGQCAGQRGVNRDITERRRAEEALQKTLADLERSNAELEQFAYVASHDLQEPLRMISSYTQLLAQRYQGKLDTDADEFIGYAVDGANRMQQLINDLLAYSRVGTQGKPPAPVPADRILDRSLENLKMILEETKAKVKREPLPTVTVDDVQLTQVFQNLVANAVKFHGDKPPRISVACREHGPEWIFSVRDNGIGIDPKYLERIFVIFQRLNPRGKYPGTGIGLAVCKKIIQRHGGRIWVESKSGEGSTFFFTLPRTNRK
jgi:PAS domain S-box-containing protein